MKAAVDILCMLTSLACAVLLFRGFVRSSAKLLLWSALCFFCFTVANGVLLVDELLYTNIDLSIWRKVPTLCGVVLLIIGLVWEAP